MKVKECTRCCVIETQDAVRFDEEGVCNVCRQIEVKKHSIDWDDRKEQLVKLCDEYRGKSTYDCLIPFSGGKDSTYQLWYLITQMNMKPLVVSFDHGFYRPPPTWRIVSGHSRNWEQTLFLLKLTGKLYGS